MSGSANPDVPDLPETCSDDRCGIPIGVIAVKIEPVTVIVVPWPETGIPDIIVGWKLGVYEGAGIAAVRLRIVRPVGAGGRIVRSGGIGVE